MAQKKEGNAEKETREIDLNDLTPPDDPTGGAAPAKPPPPFVPPDPNV